MKNIVLENKNFSLTIGEDAIAKSLIYKATGEEMLECGEDISLFSLTQLRPFNNEVKLAYMNKRTTFEANRIRVEDNKIITSDNVTTIVVQEVEKAIKEQGDYDGGDEEDWPSPDEIESTDTPANPGEDGGEEESW